jgi:hypothetical protein
MEEDAGCWMLDARCWMLAVREARSHWNTLSNVCALKWRENH